MKKNHSLGLLSSCAIMVLLSGCGVSMKPDHPQVFDSFKQRRAPKENILLESGEWANRTPERTSRFTPYTGPVNSNVSSEPASKDSALDEAKNQVQSIEQALPAATTVVPKKDNSSEQRSFWERLKEKFSDSGVQERKVIAENKITEAPVLLAQGSTDGYSYYDMANEIEPDSYYPQTLASSAPLVDVPEPESYEALRSEAEEIKSIKLKDIPEKPEMAKPVQKDSHKVVPASKPLKSVQPMVEYETDALPEPQLAPESEISDADIKDKKAEIIYTNGRQVLTGSLGAIKSSN
ncbi:MAG: hypothetical protein K0R73_286 [Candidatus Midichloriaceae bacterium]|jgi:hypothetical protein|nr:hypothetical protein [Candidatus Midichloriaceae bacterium]